MRHARIVGVEREHPRHRPPAPTRAGVEPGDATDVLAVPEMLWEAALGLHPLIKGFKTPRSPVADDWQSSTGAGAAPPPQPRADGDRPRRRGGTLASPRRCHRSAIRRLMAAPEDGKSHLDRHAVG